MPTNRSSSSHDDDRYEHLLANTNNLLSAVGISAKKISSIRELCRVASSMFVAIYESLFHVRLNGITRNPQTKEAYIANAQRVIDGLSLQINEDLPHITGVKIIQGDINALSNLINIFIRIVSITSQESQDSNYIGVLPGGKFDTSSIRSGSITTDESLFNDEVQNIHRRLGSKSKSKLNNSKLSSFKGLKLTNEELDRICKTTDAKQVLVRSRNILLLDEKLESARRRREKLHKLSSSNFSAINKKKYDTTIQTQQKRWIEDLKRDQYSYHLRKRNEEQVMLRKIYRGFLHKIHEWRLNQQSEVQEKVNMIRDEAKSHIDSLSSLFDDRVRLLREEEWANNGNKTDVINALKRIGNELVSAHTRRQLNKLSEQQSVIVQKRQQQLLLRREAHKNLLSLLSAENWNESLRQSSDR